MVRETTLLGFAILLSLAVANAAPLAIREVLDDTEPIFDDKETDVRVITASLTLIAFGGATRIPQWMAEAVSVLGIVMCAMAMLLSWAVATPTLMSDR